MALRSAIDDPRRADRACAVLTLVGAVNVPIIYFSVQWWNTLHQGASVSLTAAPKMATTDADRHARDELRRVVLRDRRRAVARACDHPRARARPRGSRRCRDRGMAAERPRRHPGCAIAQRPGHERILASMGGYGFYVWMSYGACAVADRRGSRRAARAPPPRVRGRDGRAASSAAPERDGDSAMKARHRRFAWIGAGLAALGVAVGARAQRVPVEPRVLLHAHAGAREGSAAGPAVPHRRAGRGGQPEARDGLARPCSSS